MTFKEIIQKLGQKGKERKEKFKELDEDDRMQKLVEDRKKSSNLRELERYMKEEEEKQIKGQLELMRKKRDHDINFNHNALDVPNIINKKGWEVLKEKNMFKKGENIFTHQKLIHKDNPKLFDNGRLGLCR